MIGTAGETQALDRERLRDRVRRTLVALSKTGALPTLPAAASAALALTRASVVDADALCRTVRIDVGLAARLVRLANAASAGAAPAAATVEDAVRVLGTRRTCDLVVASCTRQLYDAADPRVETLWDRALLTALAAEELARRTHRGDPAASFLVGLFHDVGRIAFLLADPLSYGVIEALAVAAGSDGLDFEREWYGFTHAEAGAILVEDWGVPAAQCEAIRTHHDGADADALLQVADRLAYAIHASEVPVSWGGARLGLTASDEAECVDRVRRAFAEHTRLL